MSRVLVTGFNARTASPRRATRDTCFAALLVTALRRCGHTVDHRDTQVVENVAASYDHVFLGIASPLAVSSNRTYPGLSIISRMWGDDALTLFVDDPDLSKIPHGLASLARRPEQFTKDFFASRVDFATAQRSVYRKALLDAAEMLRTQEWPRLLVPAWPWWDRAKMLAALPLPMQANAQMLDLSSLVPDHDTREAERRDYWITEERFDSAWVRSMNLHRYVNYRTRLHDRHRAVEYSYAWGVLDPAPGAMLHGWFRPRMVLAARAGALYVSPWQSLVRLGTMYTLLPHDFDALTPATRDITAERQRERLEKLTWSPAKALEEVGRLLPTQSAAEGV